MAGKRETSRTQSPGVLLHFCILFSCLATYICIILIAFATEWAQSASERGLPLGPWLRVEVGTTITVVRVLQGLLSATCTILLTRTLLYLKWSLIQRRGPQGIRYTTMLAISPTTLDWGSLRLIFASASRLPARFWALLRLSLVALIWLSGMLLFFRTSIVTVYDTIEPFEGSAGVGPFNGSYLDGFLQSLANTAPDHPFSILPYSYYGIVYNLISNPLFTTAVDPLHCSKSVNNMDCQAYLLSGGLSMITPFNPGGHRDTHPLALVRETPTIQLDFNSGRLSSNAPSSNPPESECSTFASNTTLIGIKLCISPLPASPETLVATLFACEGLSPAGSCLTPDPAQNLTTTISFSSRTATILTSRANLTVLSVSDLSPPEPAPFSPSDLQSYRAAIAWLLDYEKAGIPAPSSIVESFWTLRNQLSSTTADGVLLLQMRSVLAFPVWLFNGNNWGRGDETTRGEEFVRRGEVVREVAKLRFDRVVLGVFVAVQGGVLVVLMAGWVWILMGVFGGKGGGMPNVSSYPLFDAGFRSEVVGGEGEREKAWGADDGEVLEVVDGVRVVVKGGELKAGG
ncbi:hypothetical protein QBC34DRAFT_352135 [Podospora aff. communis PSN243]|uniref:Uncharacterized protein n=1 Tax=Podospora aff. communis PSN243 TaxID=3040156 RepID=A0AAV9GL45_9PEZI|nr:hypothetical protein QBC34DRAFT_352135 [Podospora aff. communis PSN243]